MGIRDKLKKNTTNDGFPLWAESENKIKKIETNISILETKINTLTEQLHSEEVLNDYQKYNQINDEISELENQLNTLMEEWEALQ